MSTSQRHVAVVGDLYRDGVALEALIRPKGCTRLGDK